MDNKELYIKLAKEYGNYSLPTDYFSKDYNELKQLKRFQLEKVVDEAIIHKAKFSSFQYEFLKLKLDKTFNEKVSKNIRLFAEMSSSKLQIIDSQIFYPAKNLLADLVEKEAIAREKKIVRNSIIRDIGVFIVGLLLGYVVNLTTPYFQELLGLNKPIEVNVLDIPIIKENKDLKESSISNTKIIDSLKILNEEFQTKLDTINTIK